MANTLANLARMYCETTGTGTLTLTNAVPGFNSFDDAGVPDGATITYAIYCGPHREIGAGVWTEATKTLTRATVYSSTNGGSKIVLAGKSEVFITPAKEDLESYATDLTAHLNDTTDAHDASAISFSATGGISSTDVQAAIAELDSEKLSTATAASTYQPLDGDLTALAALSGTNTLYYRSAADTWSAVTVNATLGFSGGTLGGSLASNYQPLDSELSAIAGLTSAADRLPYFTGSGTAALATFTTAGRNLVDDADASAQRTTLGLGTAAVKNTGASGDAVPLLNASNTWSTSTVQTFGSGTATGAAVDIFLDTSFGAQLGLVSADGGASRGPNLLFRRVSASPAASDDGGAFLWQMNDDAATPNVVSAATIGIRAGAVTSGAYTGNLRFQTMQAGTLALRMQLMAGLVVGAPTGSDKGTGSINAVNVYDDSVLLCAPVEYMKSGTVNTAMWDEYAIDIEVPETENQDPVLIEVDLAKPIERVVAERDGTLRRVIETKALVPVLDEAPVLDEDGKVVGTRKVPRIDRKKTPAKTIKRKNELAHEFKAMLDEGFDPRDPKAYFSKMLADEALPGLKTKANWVPNEESNAKRTNRIILALELQTAAFKTVYEQVEALKAEVAALKKGKP